MGQLQPGALVERSGEGNSIATIVWHLAGNLESRCTDFLTAEGRSPGATGTRSSRSGMCRPQTTGSI